MLIILSYFLLRQLEITTKLTYIRHNEAVLQRELIVEHSISNKEYPKMKGNANTGRKYDLQDRFIDYSVRIIKVSESLPNNKAGKHISSQILRSGTSAAPNYGEAQSAESKADFIHKLKIGLKEMRETEIWLKIIVKSNLIEPRSKLESILKETDELISILFTSIETARANMK